MKKLLLISSIALLTISGGVNAQELEHTGSIEGGLTSARGNTDNDNYNGAVKLNSTYGDVVNEFKASAFNSSQSGVRAGEQYMVNDTVKKKLDNKQYVFGEVDWANDRFAGFSHRLAGLAGYGYKFIEQPNLALGGEVGAGYRETDFIPNNIEDESSAVGKIGGDLTWKINEHVEFAQEGNFVFGEENLVTTSETSVKTFLNEQLYLKFAYHYENMTEVPPGRKNTDTLTSFSVGYDF